MFLTLGQTQRTCLLMFLTLVGRLRRALRLALGQRRTQPGAEDAGEQDAGEQDAAAPGAGRSCPRGRLLGRLGRGWQRTQCSLLPLLVLRADAYHARSAPAPSMRMDSTPVRRKVRLAVGFARRAAVERETVSAARPGTSQRGRDAGSSCCCHLALACVGGWRRRLRRLE